MGNLILREYSGAWLHRLLALSAGSPGPGGQWWPGCRPGFGSSEGEQPLPVRQLGCV